MCGIIGYCGEKNASQVLINSLKNLEYRGYDSCGVSVVFENKIYTKKDILKINKFENVYNFNLISGNKGIGHTRWATHGEVNKKNAHSHLSNDGNISVVHNGIIENYLEQKQFLEEKGFLFESETDSEVIPKMIEYQMQNGFDFINAVKKSFEILEGQYAVLAMHSEGKIVAIRKEAPLVVGVGEVDGEYFISSDVIGFLEHSKNAIFLEENDMVVIADGFSIFNLKENNFVKLKHGANVLITKDVPFIVFISEETEKETLNNAIEVKSRGVYVIGVSPKNNSVFDFFIKVLEAGVFNPIVQIIPMQIVAYQLALLRGCDPDFPRNLAKSVTVR